VQFTYAPSHAERQRTAPTVVLCVVALHVLAIGALFLSPQAPHIDSPKSMAIEMVLAPVSHTQPAAQAMVTPTPKVTATPVATSAKTTAINPSAAVTAPSSPTTPSPALTSRSTDAPAATAPTGSARTPSASSGASSASGASSGSPAFSLPSSEAHGLNNPQPVYPRVSRRLNEQGQVVIRVFVTVDGAAQQGEIKTSSGYDRLDQEALRTVLRWRFVPGQRLGTPEAMWFNVPVNFVLE